jgi:polyisoprenoid-binding protein YceI
MHTLIGFSVKNMVVSTVKGRFTVFQGRIFGDLDEPTDARVEVTVDASSIDTGNHRRDEHLRSADFLDVETYPAITYQSTRIERLSEDHYKVLGDLTIKDITKEVELEASINGVGTTTSGQDSMDVTATGVLSRKEWGVKWNTILEAGGVLIGDAVRINLKIRAVTPAVTADSHL